MANIWSGLTEYLVPVEETDCGEYVYRMPLKLQTHINKKGETKFKYEVEEHFKIILSALLNTSGGMIHLVPQIHEKPLGDKDCDEWLNSLKDKLNFVPADIYQSCISVHVKSGVAFIMVNKANQFVTVNSHLHSRGVAGNIKIQEYSSISRVICSSTESTSNATTPRGPFIYGNKCPTMESQTLEFKCYEDKPGVDEVEHLIGKLADERDLRAIFGMANLTSGGNIVLGIKEDPSTKANVYTGQRLSVSRENEFKKKLQKLLRKDGNRHHIWGLTTTVPEEGTHWSCEFIPLQMSSPKILQTRRVLIVIHLFHCPRGAFLDTPEAYSLDDDGAIEQMDFEDWTLLHTRMSTHTSSPTGEPLWKKSRSLTVSASPSMNKGDHRQAAKRTELTPESIFQENTSICYTKHSSKWKSIDSMNKQRTVQHPDVIDLFKTSDPVKYNPCRETLQHILTRFGLQAFLSLVETGVGEPGFGIAADMLWNCLKHSSSLTTPPQRHVLDVLIVTESARMILAAAVPECNTASGVKSLNAYKVILARILKRRMIESMSVEHSTRTYSKFTIECQLREADGSARPCPDFIMNWFTGLNFKALCSALASVLKNVNTCFRALISRDEDLILSTEQMDVLKNLDPNQFSIIEGPPGCGKSLLARRFTASKGDSAAYISASGALTKRAQANPDIRAYYVKDSTRILCLLEKIPKYVQHIVIDDHHRYSYTEDQLHELCKIISKRNQALHIFQDSKFQNYHSGITNNLKSFLSMHEEMYGSVFTKTMNTIYRNSQVVGSYLQTQISDLESARTEVTCSSSVKGDEIITRQISNLRESSAENGLLKHIQDFLEPSIAPHHHHYTYSDIVILVEDDEETTEEDVALFRSILKNNRPTWQVQNAAEFPVKGIIVDKVCNFLGCESRVVLFILARRRTHYTSLTEEQQTKYRIALASRGLDRVDFLQESNLDGGTVAKMNCDLYPRHALTVPERQASQGVPDDKPVEIENCVIKGFHVYEVQPPLYRPLRVDGERDNIHDENACLVWMPGEALSGELLNTIFDTEGCLTKAGIESNEGIVVGSVPRGLAGAFRVLLGQNASIEAIPTGLGIDSFHPWPEVFETGGGKVIPCTYSIKNYSNRQVAVGIVQEAVAKMPEKGVLDVS